MSTTSSSSLSQASTKINGESAPVAEPKSRPRQVLKHAVQATMAQDVLLFLIAFRILNALTIKTFFQPDEFFQSLEPAWQMVFGSQSGAWITWEWKNQLRSAIHPAIFAGVFYVANFLSEALRLSPLGRDELLIAAPKTLQAGFAALGDYYTWKLAGRIYGTGSNEAWTALTLTVLSPWQWFCSTRTLSNCLETSLTITALYLWPWQWSLGSEDQEPDILRTSGPENEGRTEDNEVARVRRCLFLAALACVLRPTNLLIWLLLVIFTLLSPTTGGWLVPFPWISHPVLVEFSAFWFHGATKREMATLVREATVCGAVILALASLVDRLYYQTWTFPPLKFLHFNIVQSLAIFYGRNRLDYYLTEGFPLLLTTALPFTLFGIYRAFYPAQDSTAHPLARAITRQLASISLLVPAALSLIAHKEVRFIYPLLPPLHILSAPVLSAFFLPSLATSYRRTHSSRIFLKRVLLTTVLVLNLTIAIYTTLVHQRGPLSVLTYLRHEHAIHYLATRPSPQYMSPIATRKSLSENSASTLMTISFLMPCHSTPWASHLIHPSISAWALSCDPPLGLNTTAKLTYLDEADLFYADPARFLRQHMVGGLRRPPRPAHPFLPSRSARGGGKGGGHVVTVPPRAGTMQDVRSGKHEWPDYMVFFEQLEGTMLVLLRGSGYVECWRGFNTHWHDDWRRRGDIIAWCLFPERAQAHVEAEAQKEKNIKIKEIRDRADAVVKEAGDWWTLIRYGDRESKVRKAKVADETASWTQGLWPWSKPLEKKPPPKKSWWRRSQWS